MAEAKRLTVRHVEFVRPTETEPAALIATLHEGPLTLQVEALDSEAARMSGLFSPGARVDVSDPPIPNPVPSR